MDLGLIIQLVSGAVGGNIAGNLMQKNSLGTVLNSVIGIVGGGLGAQVMSALGIAGAASAGGMDIVSILSQIASGGIGGGILLTVISLIKNMMAKQS